MAKCSGIRAARSGKVVSRWICTDLSSLAVDRVLDQRGLCLSSSLMESARTYLSPMTFFCYA